MLNDDYKEILQILSGNKVKFLVVGAYAMGVHGYPRATGDLDIWVYVSSDNSERVYKSLVEFGAPLSHINRDTFTEEGIVLQIGIAPRRIDIITQIDGVEFQNAYGQKFMVELEGLAIPFLSKDDLIRNKESTGREKDRVDAQYLRNPSDK